MSEKTVLGEKTVQALISGRLDTLNKQQIEDFVVLSRSIAKAHDNLTGWIIASVGVHVGTLAALLIVIVR